MSDFTKPRRVSIDAQMAIVEAGQASLDEVFMPYMLDGSGQTLYLAFSGNLLGDGE